MISMKRYTTIGIVGSRRRDSEEDYQKVLTKFKSIYKGEVRIVSGGCPQGADRFAERIAREMSIPIMIHYPNWKKYGKSAGFIRNADIANDADILIACVAPDRKGGTENTLKKFKSKKKGWVAIV